MPLRAVCLSLLLLAPLTHAEGEQRAGRAVRIEQLLGELHAADLFEGAALVADDRGVVYQGAYGTADRTWDHAATVDTRFLLASITKQFTAAVIMQLVEADKLALDGTLGSYLPDWAEHPAGKATLHQLLNHSSGLPLGYQQVEGFDRIELYRRHTTARVLELHREIEPIFKPGEGHSYSNFAFTLLAAVIERIEGTPYPEVLRRRIFEPLGMSDTLEPRLAAVVPRMARGYAPVLDDYVEASPTDLSIVRGAACHASTVRDLYRWDRGLYDDAFLSPASREKMFTPSAEGFGYAWVRQQVALVGGGSLEVVRHDGLWPGHMTVIVRVPEHRVAVVLMANRNDVDVNAIADLLLQAHYDRPAELPPRSAARRLYGKLAAEGVATAAADYRKLSTDAAYALPSERRMNGQAYLLLRLKRVSEAVAVFELIAELYADSSNAHDSLAEGYLEADRLDAAARACRRSLELNRDNTIAREMLEKILERRKIAG